MYTIAHARQAFNTIVDEAKHLYLTGPYGTEDAASRICAEAPISRLMLALLFVAVNDGHEFQHEPAPKTGTIGEALAEELADYVAMVIEDD